MGLSGMLVYQDASRDKTIQRNVRAALDLASYSKEALMSEAKRLEMEGLIVIVEWEAYAIEVFE